MINEPAEQKYEELLRANPNQPGMWRALGESQLRAKKLPQARVAFENAVRLDPVIGEAHFGLANVFREQGHPAQAISSLRAGLTRTPDNPQALLDLGVLLAEQGQVDEAVGCWQKLLIHQPNHAQAHHNMGVAMAQKGQPLEAIRNLERAIALRPDYAEAFFNLANVLGEQKSRDHDRRGEAVEHYLKAIRLRPGYIEALYNLGSVLVGLNRPAEAAVWLRQAARLGRGPRESREQKVESRQNTNQAQPPAAPHPLTASAFNQLGVAFSALGKYRAAASSYQRALGIRPDSAETHCNLANLYQELGRLPRPLACYELALLHEPQSAVTKWNRSLSLLQSGDFERGWSEYEWRWQRKQTPARKFAEPRWDGSPLEGRTLLIYMEQGMGDMIQFIRFAASAKERGGRVLVECPHFLLPLLMRCPGIDEIVPEGTLGAAGSPRFDVQIPVMSLPGVLGITLEMLPNRMPYVFVEEGLVEKWRVRLEEAMIQAPVDVGRTPVVTPPAPPCEGGEKITDAFPSATHEFPLTAHDQRTTKHDSRFTIGIAWQGNPNHRLDRYRSIPLPAFGQLARVGKPGCAYRW